MRPPSCVRALGPWAASVLVADVSRRLLSPHRPPPQGPQVKAESYFSAEEMARGASFSRPQLALALARETVTVASLVLALGLPRRRALGLAPVARLVPAARRRRRPATPAEGALVTVRLMLLMTAAQLPLAAVARRRARAVGLITQSWRGWALDLLKATAIEGVLAGAAGAGALGLIRRYPRRWWLPLAGASVGAGGLLGTLAPVLMDPMFNRFEPLPEGPTRQDVLDLATAAGARIGEVYRVDASRRTTGANAYVTGLGPTKRVVLFDTLLSRYDRDEVRVVVAHELSHLAGRDVLRSLAFAAAVGPLATLAVQQLSWCLSGERQDAQAIPALALAAMIVLAPISLIANGLSRAVERRADADSLELSDAPQAFVSFERKITLQNVADVDPPRWVSRLLATHPPTLERIGAAVAYAERKGDKAPGTY